MPRPRRRAKRIVFTIPQQHFDPVWRKPKAQYLEWQFNHLSKFLAIARRHPEYTFVEGQACVMRNYFEALCPEAKPFFLQLIKEGRYEMVTGMEVIPDTNLPCGESLIRTALLGKRYLREDFGAEVETAWYYDTFGLNAQSPQILKKCGFKWLHAIRFGRMDVELPCWWEGLDGTTILTHSKEYAHNSWEYAALERALGIFQNLQNFRKFVAPDQTARNLDKFPPYYRQKPTGEHWWYEPVSEEEVPSWHLVKCLKEFNEKQDELEFRFGLPRDYFHALEGEIRRGRKLPHFDGEMNPELPGCYTTRHWLKQLNRRAEAALLAAESLAAIGRGFGAKHPSAELREAWRRLCYTHHHDAICGCHIDSIEDDLLEDFWAALAVAERVIDQNMRLIGRKADTRGPGQAIAVFNPLSWKRTDAAVVEIDEADLPVGAALAVVDASGQRYPALAGRATASGKVRVEFLAADAPSMGYKIYRLVAAEPLSSALRKSRNAIENEYYRVEASDKGVLRIHDKELRRDVADSTVGFANELYCEEDLGGVYVAGLTGRSVAAREGRSRVAKVAVNPLYASVLIKGTFPRLPWLETSHLAFEQEIRLYGGLKRVDFLTRLDWKGQQTRISVRFPTPIRKDDALYSIPFGAIRRARHAPNGPPGIDRDWPAQTWFSLDDGVFGITLTNDGTPGTRVFDGVMHMSLLRSPLSGNGLDSPWSADRAMAHGRHEYRYTLTSHKGNALESLAFRAGYELNHPFAAAPVASSAGPLPAEKSYVSVDADNVIVTAFKTSEYDVKNLVIRAFETTGEPARAAFALPDRSFGLQEVDMIEDTIPGRQGSEKKSRSVQFGRFDIRTFLLKG